MAIIKFSLGVLGAITMAIAAMLIAVAVGLITWIGSEDAVVIPEIHLSPTNGMVLAEDVDFLFEESRFVPDLGTASLRIRSADDSPLFAGITDRLTADRFLDELMESPQYLLAVTRNLSAQLRRANRRLVTRNSDSAVVRTGRMIVELSALMMRHSADACSDACEVPITQHDLADWVGTTRESTARALAKFRQAGFVTTSRGSIVVLDPVGLSRFVAEY